jgi:predicted MFS family arabinose efflux permease
VGPAGRRLLLAQAVSELGDFVGLSALIILAFHTSGTVLGPAGVYAAEALPAVLVGTVGSGQLDRPPRREMLVSLSLIGGVVMAVVAAAPGLVAALVVAAILSGTRTAYQGVSTGAVVDAIPAEARSVFFARSVMINDGSQVIGLGTGALVAVLVSTRVALAFDAGTFVVAAVILATLQRLPGRSGETPGSPLDGLRVVARVPVLRRIAPLALANGAVVSLPEVMAPRLAHGAAVSVLLVCFPVGSIAAVAVVARSSGIRRLSVQLRLAGGMALAFGADAVAVAAGSRLGAMCVATLAVGVASVWLVGGRTTFAANTPPGRMAQVESLMVASVTVAEGVGAIGLAALASPLGTWAPYAASALVVFLGLGVGRALGGRVEDPSMEAIMPPWGAGGTGGTGGPGGTGDVRDAR